MRAGYVEDTIAAVATAAGVGAISILRLSGKEALAVARRVLRERSRDTPLPEDPPESHRARIARLVSPASGRTLDEVLFLPMLAPRSFTGEDVIEIHCHGGRLIAELALRALLDAGARAARPGEFTERAFLNGRLDLCQAEAVADLVEARSQAGLSAALALLGGALSREIAPIRDGILDVRALVEAHLDFPEDDLPAGVEREALELITRQQSRLETLMGSFARGRLARDGLRVVLVGKPNVGKSSLLNALLGRDRALVSEEPGTTRDYLEEPLAIGNLLALLCDTAGIREAATGLERAGVEQSRRRIADADVVLIVLDGTRPLDAEDRLVIDATTERARILVRSKIDLPPVWHPRSSDVPPQGAWVDVSAHQRLGLDRLCEAIEACLPAEPEERDEVLVTRARHHVALSGACARLGVARDGLSRGSALELVAADLQAATFELDELVGASSTEDVLDRIFRQFCVGK